MRLGSLASSMQLAMTALHAVAMHPRRYSLSAIEPALECLRGGDFDTTAVQLIQLDRLVALGDVADA
jgi:hypothetical protein